MKKISIEERLESLKAILSTLEQEETSLSESLALFEKGIKTYRESLEEIEAVKGRISRLVDGELLEVDEEELHE